MNKSEIISRLKDSHSQLWETAMQLPYPALALNEKWSVCQNVEHINIALMRLGNFLALPKATIEIQFGLSGRTSVSYSELTRTYLDAMSQGVRATGVFIPELNPNANLEELIDSGKNLLNIFILNLQDWSENELDDYNCLHPALGTIKVREILYFTIYHAQHHQQIILKNASQSY